MSERGSEMPARTTTALSAQVSTKLVLPESVYDAYDAQATRLRKPVEQVLADQLTTFSAYPVDTRVLVLGPAEREGLEQLLQTTFVDSPSLLRSIRKAVEISVQGVRLSLEPWQLAELKRRAERNERSIKEELEAAVKQIQSLVFG